MGQLGVEAIGVAFVELCAKPLRGSAIHGFLDQDVPKAELSRRDRPYEPPRGQPMDVHPGRRRSVGLEEGGDVVEPELLPDDGSALEHGTLTGAEPVEAGREQGLHRCRNRPGAQPAFERVGQKLLEEERVALCS